jgi:hypothetical protein
MHEGLSTFGGVAGSGFFNKLHVKVPMWHSFLPYRAPLPFPDTLPAVCIILSVHRIGEQLRFDLIENDAYI